MTDAFDIGVEAAKNDAWLADNPYEENTQNHSDWANGWNAWFDLLDLTDPVNFS